MFNIGAVAGAHVHVEEEAHVREAMGNRVKAVQGVQGDLEDLGEVHVSEDLEDPGEVHVSGDLEEGARESEARGETSNLEAADAQS